MKELRDVQQRSSIGKLAQELEMHPFDLLRVVVGENLLSADLRYGPTEASRVVHAAGLEAWWDVPPRRRPGETQGQALMQAVLGAMFSRGVIEPHSARADNLFRGLDPETRAAMRRVVNALIRAGVLTSSMTAKGLSVTIPAGTLESVRSFVEEGSGGVVEVWRAL